MGNKCRFLLWRVISCYLLLVIRLQEEVVDHRNTRCLRLEGASRDHFIQPPCSKNSHLQQVVLGCVLLGFEHLQGQGFFHLSGQPVQHLISHTGKTFSHKFKRNFLYLNLCPPPVVLSLGTTEKGPAPPSLLPHQVFLYIGKTSISLLFPG